MDQPQPNIKSSSNYRPGEPLRPWTDGWPGETDLALVIKGSQSGASVVRLLNGDELSKDDVIAFGRLNALCVLQWYEPLVNLLGPRSPEISPEHAELIRRHTKLFRGA